MKVCINGLRQNATLAINDLSATLHRHIMNGGSHIEEWQKQEIIESFNSAASAVGMFNCVYHPDIDGFDDLSDELSVDFLEDE